MSGNPNQKPDLSIIIPFAGEYPQVLFTIQATAQSLLGSGISFEILAIDNHCWELEQQWERANTDVTLALIKKFKSISDADLSGGAISDLAKIEYQKLPRCKPSNPSGEAIKAAAGHNPWLRYFDFKGWLSHWECKRLACKEARADTFLFLDAHTVPSPGIADMLKAYSYFRTEGSFHMPLTYKILEWRRLIYQLSIEKGFWGYAFDSLPDTPDGCTNREPMEVPCMSTCGMMLSREIYDKVGGWPQLMTAYGGGENFMNFSMAACGFKKWIFTPVTLFHHGEKRDYHYTFDGMLWNRLLSHYLFGGTKYMEKLADHSKGDKKQIRHFYEAICTTPAFTDHRAIIKENTNTDLTEWRKKWEG